MALIVGQVLWLISRFNNTGEISQGVHPYLIVEINQEDGYCEVAQLDSMENKLHKALLKSNKIIPARNPPETVVTMDGYAQLDNTFRFELYDGLESFRRTEDTLSRIRLEQVIKAYKEYHEKNEIDEDKNVFMSQEEIEKLNS